MSAGERARAGISSQFASVDALTLAGVISGAHSINTNRLSRSGRLDTARSVMIISISNRVWTWAAARASLTSPAGSQSALRPHTLRVHRQSLDFRASRFVVNPIHQTPVLNS
jgi:hypothetical protein